MKGKRKLSVLTAYDYPTARILSRAGIDMLLVGDSLGMVVLGYKDTRDVTLEDMIRHTAAVVRGSENTLVIADMPFGSTDSIGTSLINARRMIQETGCHAIKIEGQAEVVENLVRSGIEVMGHTGLKPQTALRYTLQGKESHQASVIFDEAVALEKAGAFALVLECIPARLASEITQYVKIPTIGIGAGSTCDGQVLVVSDMLGLFKDFKPKFVRHYADISSVISEAALEFKKDVENGKFPSPNESY